MPARAQGHAERSQGPVSPPRGQQERPRFGFVAGLPQVSGQRLRVPAPLLAGQEVLNDARVEGCGHARPQQLGVQEQGKQLSVTVRVIHLQEIRQARREGGNSSCSLQTRHTAHAPRRFAGHCPVAFVIINMCPPVTGPAPQARVGREYL